MTIKDFNFWDADTGETIAGSRHNPKKADPRALSVKRKGRNIAFGGKGGGSSPDPDPRVGEAALANVALGKEWLGFAREQFTEGNKRQDVTDALTKQVIDQQLATQDQTNKWGQEDRARTKEVFQPLQDQFIEEANAFDTPAKQAEAAAAAKADVQNAATQQQQIQQRNMAGMGVNPNSGRYQGVARMAELGTAISSAGAQNNARTVIQDKGRALRADAVNIGNGLASSTAAAYGIGLNAGNSAVGNNAAANANFYQNNQTMTNGYAGAIGANQSAGGLLNQQFATVSNNANASNAASSAAGASNGAAIGGVIGAVAIAF